MRHAVLLLALPLTLAACDHKEQEETQTTVTKNGVTTTTITRREVDADAAKPGGGLSIDSDKFKANVEIPGLSFGADHMDLDGMKLYPGSTVKGVHVRAVDRGDNDRGEVTMDFSSPAGPAAVARHMADQARKAGFTVAASSAAVSGRKLDGGKTDDFALEVYPNGDATIGHLTMTDSKPK